MRSWPFFLLTAALAAQTQTGEVTTREEIPTFQSSVNLVRVPVVIRDKKGHTVGTFHKEDFQLTDRGKTQYISQFAIEGSAVPKPAAPAAVETEIPGEPAAAASKLVVPTRFTAFVFDDVHLKIGDMMNARVAALKRIEQGIRPEERVALLTLSGKVSLEFTNDVAKFRETLMKIMPMPPAHQTFPPATFFVADQWMNRDDNQALGMQIGITIDCLHLQGAAAAAAPKIAESTLREVASEGRGEAINSFRILNNIVRLLAAMPGDRIMILVSPGFYLPDELQRDLSESIDRATRAGVVINTLDARGVYTIDPSGDVPGCQLTNTQTQLLVVRYDNFANLAQGMVLRDLADSTGGTAVSQNDFLDEFNRLATPPEYVYYLGFYPKDLKPDGRYHEIKVKLADTKGLTVQARKGYWAPSHEEDAAATATREIGEAVFSRDELRDLPIEIHTEFFKTTEADAKLKVATHLDIRRLPLRKQDDRNRDDLTLVCALFDGNGNYIKGTQKVVELRLKDENLDHRRTQGVNVISNFDVKIGPYMIRVVVRDAEGQQMAAANGVVEIP
ncbi:MAG TPA: VWA domain-containing protein [Bryobacteraceae bacterium]|jgi:VWFA-related protein